MDPTGNFYNYRTALRGAAHRSRTANSNRERVGLGHASRHPLHFFNFILIFPSSSCLFFIPQIVIPFFSLLIKDIYFLNEGCANRLPNGHVNFEVSRSLFPDPALLYPPSNNLLSEILFLRNLSSWQGRSGSS